MNKRGLLTTNYIILLIAFILISSFLLIVLDTESISDNSLTGNAVIRASCYDSDGGRNPYVYGVVTKSQTVKKDSCSGARVKEWYCTESNSYSYKYYSCKAGYTCKAGACALK